MTKRKRRHYSATLPVASVCLCVLSIFIPATGAMAKGNGGCQIATVTGVAFGNFDPLSGAPVTANGSVTISCSGNRSFTISLSAGQSNSYAPRYMASGSTATHLDYNLYTDSTYTTVWGDGTGSTATVPGSVQNSSASFTIYGEIPAPQTTVVPGAYTDTVTMTVSY